MSFLSVAERLVEVAICLLAAWPVTRHLLKVRRSETRSSVVLIGAIGVAIYVLAVAVFAVQFPNALRVVAIVALIMIGTRLRRARTDFGARRGLPPGSLASVPARLYRNQEFYLDQFASHGPIFKVSPAFRRPNVCVVGHAAARDLLRSNAANLDVLPSRYNRHIPKGFLRYMDEADHRTYRKLFRTALSADLIGVNEPALTATMRRDLDRWARTGDGNARGLLVEPAVRATMFTVMTFLFFGVDIDDLRYEQLQLHYERLSIVADRQTEATLAVMERVLFDEPEPPPPDSVVGRILNGDPSRIEDPTVRRNLIYMVETAHLDMSGLLCWVVKILHDNRSWVDRLRVALASGSSPPVDSEGHSLADRVIMETLRLERSEYLYRRAKKPVRVGGFVIPKGWIIRICTREGHRTNPIFEHPNEFDPDRFLDRTFDHSAYAPFGMVQRRCLGVDIVADIGRLFLEQLLGPYDFELTDDGPVEFKAGHWQPSSSLRLRLIADSSARG